MVAAASYQTRTGLWSQPSVGVVGKLGVVQQWASQLREWSHWNPGSDLLRPRVGGLQSGEQ